jgi:Family of unknown function (DUF6370)
MEEAAMMKLATLGLALVLGLGFVGPVSAEETTLSGTIMCAKCTLKKADAAKCQDVLVVKDDKGATTEYYIEKNAELEKAGHTCKSEVKATVTGTVSEKDGKKWVAASKIEKAS